MVRRRIRCIAAIMLLFFASCSKETFPERGDIRLSASMGYLPTKGGSDSDSGIRDFDYDSELEIALLRLDQGSTPFPQFLNIKKEKVLFATLGKPNSAYKRDVEFTSEAQYYVNDNNTIRYASWYPAEGSYTTSKTDSKVTFDVDGSTDVLYGSVAEGNKREGFNDIVFNHALCQFNIYVYQMIFSDDGGGSNYDAEWGSLNNIIVKNVQDRCLLTLPNTANGDKYVIEHPDDRVYDLDLKNADGVFWDPGVEIPSGFENMRHVSSYIAAPPANGYITFNVDAATNGLLQKVSIVRDFKIGCAYDIVLRFTSHGLINAEASVGEWNYQNIKGNEKIIQDVSVDMYYDLSAYLTSNSYIVPAGNYGYSFIGNVKGSSTEPLNANGADPGYVDVLWCDNADIWDPEKTDNYFQLTSHSLSKNRVMFTVGNIKDTSKKTLDHKGNVVIAAYKDESKSEILWTWHIWLNDSISPVGFTNGYLALDHNLGANEPGEDGLYYQWGRKDPFEPGYFETDASRADYAETIANPTVFYGKGSDSWYDGSFSDLTKTPTWSSSTDEAHKSIYDPCPPGYYVPDSRMWSNDKIAAYQTDYVAGDYVSLAILNSEIKFPLTQGYLNADGVQTVSGMPLFLWSSSLNKAGTQPYSFQYPESNESPALTEPNIVYGGGVRCIAKAPAVYKNLSESQTANTYVVSKDGHYKFKGNIAGNGVNYIISNKGAEWDISGKMWGDGSSVEVSFEPDKVDYLWYQSELDKEIPESIFSEDICVKILNGGKLDSQGYVNLEVEGWKPGNLILAAYKGDKIVWSWHIWLTDEPEDAEGDYFVLMDRNLGATSSKPDMSTPESAIATYGFYYQWGRKDPIVGPESCKPASASNSSMPWFEYDGSAWIKKDRVSTMEGPQSVLVAAQNPQTMITVASVPSWMEGYPESEDDVIKYKVAAVWGYPCEDGAWGTKPTKTLYDPCPPGYMVPHQWLYWNVVDQVMAEAHKKKANVLDSKPSQFLPYSIYGYLWNNYSSGCNYFPLAGRRDERTGNADIVGVSGQFWACVPKGPKGRMMSLGTGYWDGLFTNNVPSDQNSKGTIGDTKHDTADAMSIRCMKQ